MEYDVDGKEGHPGGYAFVFSVGRVTQELDMTVACVELSSCTQCDVVIWFLIIM